MTRPRRAPQCKSRKPESRAQPSKRGAATALIRIFSPAPPPSSARAHSGRHSLNGKGASRKPPGVRSARKRSARPQFPRARTNYQTTRSQKFAKTRKHIPGKNKNGREKKGQKKAIFAGDFGSGDFLAFPKIGRVYFCSVRMPAMGRHSGW